MTDAVPWLWAEADVVGAVVVEVVVVVGAVVWLAELELDPPHPAKPVDSTAAARSEAIASEHPRRCLTERLSIPVLYGRRGDAPRNPRDGAHYGD